MHPLFVIDDIEGPRLLHLLPQIDDGTEDVGLGMVDVAGQPGSSRVSARREKERSGLKSKNQRMARMSQKVSDVMSHDLRTP